MVTMGEIFREHSQATVDVRMSACATTLPVAHDVAGITSGFVSSYQPLPLSDEADPQVVRAKVLDAIVRSLTVKRPSWDKGRILHLSTQLEESMFNSGESRAAYQERSNLEDRINRHCRHLANEKTSGTRTSPSERFDTSGQGTGAGVAQHQQLAGESMEPNAASQTGIMVDLEYNNDCSGWGELVGGIGTLESGVSSPGMCPSENCAQGALPMDVSPKPWQSETHTASGASLKGSLEHNRDSNTKSPEQTKERLPVAQEVKPSPWKNDVKAKEQVQGRVPVEGHGSGGEGPAQQGNKKVQDLALVYEQEIKRHALRLLQCRVLLLAHASSCTQDKRNCQLSPLCESVRQLLEHMKECKKREACDFPHCDSSKAILRHQRLCRDSACGLCRSVRDLSQKCFWANARLVHKRRLQESYELRRKKRLREGKPVSTPHKQTEKAKSGAETCSGLDEAGNHLGDITPGFFLRQDKAIKARKMMLLRAAAAKSSPVVNNTDADTSGSTAATAGKSADGKGTMGSGGLVITKQQQEHQLELQQGQEVYHASGAPRVSHGLGLPATATHSRFRGPKKLVGQRQNNVNASLQLSSGSSVNRNRTGGVSGEPRGGSAGTVSVGHLGNPPSVGRLVGHYVKTPSERMLSELAGSWADASRKPSFGRVQNMQRKTSSERMLSELADSLADTSRKPSFARIQSMQAFLEGHSDLRQSASFGDVSALVEQWMGLEYEEEDDDNLGLSNALSF